MAKINASEKKLLKTVNELIDNDPEISKALQQLNRAISLLSKKLATKLLLTVLLQKQQEQDVVQPAQENQHTTEKQKMTISKTPRATKATKANKAPKARKATDWSAVSDATLRASLYFRKKTNKTIEPELNAELIKRFPTYDSTKQSFGATPEFDWSKCSEKSLRAALYFRQKKNKKIEPELHAELIKRFPTYDPETHKFSNKRKDWSKCSEQALRKIFHSKKKANETIEPELNTELARRFPSYDPVKQIFLNIKKTQKDSQQSEGALRMMFYSRKRANKPIEKELNEELTRRFPTYDPVNQVFTKKKLRDIETAVSPAPEKPQQSVAEKESFQATTAAPTATPVVSAPVTAPVVTKSAIEPVAEPQKTETKKEKLAQTTAPKEKIAPAKPQKTTKQKAPVVTSVKYVIKPTITRHKGSTTQEAPKFTPTEDISLSIKIETVKQTLEGTYNNVFVNGKRILKNHINTEVRLYCDDTVLAIRGIVTDKSHYPESPVWLVYDTNLNNRIPEKKEYLSDYYVTARNVTMMPDAQTLRIDMSQNRTTYFLSKEKMQRIANGKRFVMEKQR